MRTDNARLELRLSREDKIKIEKAAKKCGVSVKEYVLRCCKGKESAPDLRMNSGRFSITFMLIVKTWMRKIGCSLPS